MRKLMVLLVISALILSLSAVAQTALAQAEASLAIHVVNPLGAPLKGVEVHLIKGTETRRFITNSTGYAEFKHLEPGEYVARVKRGNITLAEEKVRVPETREVTLTALIAEVKISIVNLDGEPVSGLSVALNSSGYYTSSKTDKNGTAVFDQVPYSELGGVGPYRLEVKLDKVLIYAEKLEVDRPEISEQLRVPLISLRLTVVNLEGVSVPGVTVKISAGEFSAVKRAGNGTAAFDNVPSSSVSSIGEYRIDVLMTTPGGEITIYSEKRSLTKSQSLTLIADLARLKVKVVDEDGKPVEKVEVSLSNKLAEDFASKETGKDGVVVFDNVPLSAGEAQAGTYKIKARRAGVEIAEAELEVKDPEESVELQARRNVVRIRLVDFEEKPLANYGVSLVDDLTGKEYESSTNEAGVAEFKIFYGPYELKVIKDGEPVYSKLIEVKEESMELKLADINFPFKIIVKDAFENPVKSAELKVFAGSKELFAGRLEGKPVELVLPHPAQLQCDVYAPDGKLVQRESFYADGPGSRVVRLPDYVELGGLLPLEQIAIAISSLIIALMAAAALILYRASRVKG
ncbi:MAG: carboxypeptidase regulatory-like domain-containing protein [Thaumarchaeota archaeon]|nr:carboxypeptidase regulatory-like domain-containing protein [Nitrososphaerota archaeon]